MGLFRFACYNLLSRKTRSGLALTGLTVAIAGMVGLFSVVGGLRRMTEETFGRLKGISVLQPGAPIPLFSKLPREWGAEIAELPGVRGISPELWQRANVIEGKMTISPPRFLFGIDIPSRLKLEHSFYRDDMTEGRFLTEADRGSNHIVVSHSIADEFKLKLGDEFVVNGAEFELVGIYNAHSPMIDVTLLMDEAKLREISGFDDDYVSSILVDPEPGREDEVIESIRDLFRGRKIESWMPSDLRESLGLGNPLEAMASQLDQWLKGPRPQAAPKKLPDESPPTVESESRSQNETPRTDLKIDDRLKVDTSTAVDVRSGEQWGEQIGGFTKDLDLMMMLLTSIGLVVAVLGIVNTMLMSVTERIIEIGILKANGWSRRNVLTLIACESGLLGIVGGAIGSAIGWCVTLVVNANWADRIQLYAGPSLLTFGVLFATVLGLLAGLYPAIWAMRLMPMDAIRRG